MKIEFEQGNMKVTHKSGVIDRYAIDYIQNVLAMRIQEKQRIEQEISNLQKTILNINQSLEV